jgi:hypothetical protein
MLGDSHELYGRWQCTSKRHLLTQKYARVRIRELGTQNCNVRPSACVDWCLATLRGLFENAVPKFSSQESPPVPRFFRFTFVSVYTYSIECI